MAKKVKLTQADIDYYHRAFLQAMADREEMKARKKRVASSKNKK